MIKAYRAHIGVSDVTKKKKGLKSKEMNQRPREFDFLGSFLGDLWPCCCNKENVIVAKSLVLSCDITDMHRIKCTTFMSDM